MFSLIKKFFYKDKQLFILTSLLIILSFFFHPDYNKFLNYIEWKTIFFLSGLLIITSSMKKSNYFYYLAEHISNKIHDKRKLSYFLILLSSLLAMFLTNDIALFLIVPFTIELKKIMNLDFTKIILLEILSVNVGSSLTPIGNPQNVFLWHHFNINFFKFILTMFPVFCFQLLLLFIFSFFIIKKQNIELNLSEESYNKWSFYISLLLLVMFIIISKTHYFIPFFIFIFIYYIFSNKKIIFDSDWNLIITFILFS
ncbi:SLC13 family permease [Marinitoga lauensis]|uniref:SLC13 family permease n=1 Tax=Marinitoga lauensis TaxID=2201189 RepID=UPI001404C758|nr:SLC13 family permease [Marinitoga lauensis]